ncbi:MAG TPA: ParB/RepB/Spo0J family partition protein [Rhodospirillales bacterium]
MSEEGKEGKEGKRRQLGRGLNALFGDEGADYAELDRVRISKPVPIEYLQPGRFQPRRRFDEAEIEGLVESIRANGILQPILVRRLPESPDKFEIVAGERRWRAAQKALLHEVPVIIKDLADGDALEIALVENLQRQDLAPLEEADAYRRLMDEFGNTQEDLARALGKSRSHIANTVRLLELPESVKNLVEEGKLSAGHARALLGAKDAEKLARQIVARGLNVRQAEVLARGDKDGGKRKAPAKDADTRALEAEVSNLLGLKVTINHRGAGGVVMIGYHTLEQLDDLLRRLSQPAPVERPRRTGVEALAESRGTRFGNETKSPAAPAKSDAESNAESGAASDTAPPAAPPGAPE